MTQPKIATQIVKRQKQAEQLIKLAVGSFNSMPGKIPGWSEPTQAKLSTPKPATPTLPKPPVPAAPKPAAPPAYRGQNELGGLNITPTRAPYMKTWEQLNTEQGITENTAPRHGVMDSLNAGLAGGAGAVGGALGNIGGLVATPFAAAADGIGWMAGYNPGATEAVGDFRAVSQDMRDRGLHQFLMNTRSRALRDRMQTTQQQINENLPSGSPMQHVGNFSYGAAQGAEQIAPFLTPAGPIIGGSAHLAGRGVDATGLVAPNEYQADTATVQLDANGKPIVQMQNMSPREFSQLSPADAQTVAGQNPETMLAAINNGEVPNNLKTPAERVSSGAPTVDGTEQAATQANTPPQQQAAQQQPATPAPPTADQQAAVEKSLADAAAPNASPELKAKAEADLKGFVEAQAAANPGLANGAKAFLAGDYQDKDAVAFRQHLDKVGNNVMDAKLKELYGETPNPTPEQAGNMFAQAQDFWTNLPPEAKIMVGIGLPLGLVGIGSMLFGGGMGGMLAGVLGLGAAGLVGANAGMFGDDARRMVGQAGLGIMDALGVKTPDVSQLSGLTEAEVEKRVQQALETGGAEAAQAELEKIRGQVGVIRDYNPDLAVTGMLARGAVPTSEAGYELLSRGNKFLDDTADPNFIYNRAMQQGRQQFGDTVRERHPWLSWLAKPDYDNRANDWLWGAPEKRDQYIADELKKRYNLQKRSALNVLNKATTRWATT